MLQNGVVCYVCCLAETLTAEVLSRKPNKVWMTKVMMVANVGMTAVTVELTFWT